MDKDNYIIIAGEKVSLRKMECSELKGLYIDAIVSFEFFMTSFQGNEFVLLVPKNLNRYTPIQYAGIANRLKNILNKPIAFLFDDLIYYKRNRMIAKGAYFVVSNKYVYLPFIVINARSVETDEKSFLSPVAQYLLLYHLQVKSLNGKTYEQVEELVPYKYVTITRAIKLLKQFGLCKTSRVLDSPMTLHFPDESKKLWEKAQPYLISPIKFTLFCDGMTIREKQWMCSYNALSRYSNLNPDSQQMVAIENATFKKSKDTNAFTGLNKLDGDIKLEIWEYPPVCDGEVVDKLSLFLSLRDDKDARVEKELEIMMNNIWLQE